MASRALRQAVFAAYAGSSVLANIGYTEPNIYPNFSPDSPASDLFLVLRWGITQRGFGNVNSCSLTCWAYNRQPDYGPIADALLEIRRLLPLLIAVRMNPAEAVLGVVYGGDSDDLYDDGYRAYTRWTSHTITASGS